MLANLCHSRRRLNPGDKTYVVGEGDEGPLQNDRYCEGVIPYAIEAVA
jgi:hypothetical protein